MKKIALFFGAGAEYSYGLPSGGKFALDIFRMNTNEDKENFKKQLREIDYESRYAKWLPDNLENKNITAFTKGQYDSLVKGSLENKRNQILEYFSHFDDNVHNIIERSNKKGVNIDNIIEGLLGENIGDHTFGKEIKLNKIFEQRDNDLFESDYFSALLKIMQIDGIEPKLRYCIKEVIRAILELLIGSLGEQLTHNLNDGIFEKSPDSIDVFDDLGAIFTLDYKNTGMKGLDMIINEKSSNVGKVESQEEILINFGFEILEDIYSRALDYQTLIDMNWRYIYTPQTDWGKFSKIVIFLNTVRRYITGIAETCRETINQGDGYYHDILEIKKIAEINGVGTTNYNTFIEEVIEEKVSYLNGCVNDYYDPYLNRIVSLEDNEDRKHIVVPFLFTQSGIKPLTSIKMSERYVSLYKQFEEADIICICGFGFNADDGHINGMFRELIEDSGKKLTILYYCNEFNEKKAKTEFQDRLRLSSKNNIEIIPVNDKREDIRTNRKWYESLRL
ncbi:hypothetical protein ACTNDG_07150 [Clostridium sp. HCP1S3_B4]|uniref:hypothetical protein n=1 Tax=unclassified Clostridium TaxID=2614128 RepID=UPI003F8BA7F8